MPSLLFLTLRTFSATGGIEKVCRVAGKALAELKPGKQLQVYSLYDKSSQVNPEYIRSEQFRGFDQQKVSFIWQTFLAGRKCELVILSHVNLLPAIILLRLFAPRVRIALFAHGIEVWSPVAGWKRWVMQGLWRILCVSEFTRDKIIPLHGLDVDRVTVLHNALDPLLPEPLTGPKSAQLLQRYQLKETDRIFMTLTRIASTEGYKGYDLVIEAVANLQSMYPNLRYLMVGKYDTKEKQRLDQLIDKFGVRDRVIFAGFVPDDELAAHFQLADVYIMPSQKEGFGIVFIEALYYGKPVIGGNKDGSVDALGQGELGTLVDPDSLDEIRAAMESHLNQSMPVIDDALIQSRFGYTAYKQKWQSILAQV